jgi:succinate-semialdehyde dehydrogenase / glutarate-semialdehyde dehydrogenase
VVGTAKISRRNQRIAEKMKVRNPRTGEFDYEISPPNFDELKVICESLRSKQEVWSNSPIEHRIEVVLAWKKAVLEYRTELIESISIDTGRYHESVLEADLIGSSIDRWGNISRDFFSPTIQKQSSIPFISLEQNLVPYSLVGVISPWNFPLLLSLIDTIPALMAGCAVIVKPSEITPRFIKIIQKTIEKVPELPLFYIEGAGQTGSDLCDLTDLICFTGSTATGRKVYQKACDNFIPVFLELGGKDAALVFEDANLDHATSALLWGSVVNAGQSCLSVERIYVQDTVYQEFIEKIKAKTEALKLAYPTPTDGQIGPIISDKQVEIINSHLSDALNKGAKLVAGNEQCIELGGGFYCEPTILTNVNDTMKVMTEETFGPIMPILTFSTEKEAIELFNSTIYGLSGAVFAEQNKALRIAQKLNCGAISINDAALTAIMHEGEKNAFKLSGIGGTRMGANAIKRFMRQKVNIIKTQNIPSPWWFG